MTSWIKLAKKISEFAYLQQELYDRRGLDMIPWKPRFDPLRISRIGREQYRELLLQDVLFYNELTRVKMQDLKRALSRNGWTCTPDGMKWKKDGLSLDFCDALGAEFGEDEKNAWLYACELEVLFDTAWEAFFAYSRKDPQGGIDRLERAEETMTRRNGA